MIARQTPGKRGGHLSEENAGGSQCVVSGNSACGDLAGHKTGRDAAAHILAGLAPKISIERINAAGKRGAIMAWRKRLYDEFTRHPNNGINVMMGST